MPVIHSEPLFNLPAQDTASATRLYPPDSQLTRLDISCIRTDCGTQARAELNGRVVAEYALAMQQGALFPPVTVFHDGQNYYLADGFHRLEATKQLKSATIAVDVRSGHCRDAMLYSVGANTTHGLRRSNIDKRRAVMMLLKDPEWSLWTNTAIARMCGVDEGLVRLIKSELSPDNPEIDKRALAKKCGVGLPLLEAAITQVQALPQERTAQRNGKTYKVNTTRIGKSCRTITASDEPISTVMVADAQQAGVNQVAAPLLRAKTAPATTRFNPVPPKLSLDINTAEICMMLMRNVQGLADTQVEVVVSALAYHLSLDLFNLHDWSDDRLKCTIKELKHIIKLAKHELNKRQQAKYANSKVSRS